MAVGVGDAVRITARILPSGTVRRDFGRTLLLDRTSVVATTRANASRIRRVGVYPTRTHLTADTPSTELASGADVYFAQIPFPGNLLVGTVIDAIQPSLVFGGAPSTVVLIAALGNNVTLSLGGVDFMADFDGLTTFDAIAAALATGINAVAGFTGVTVTHTDGAFVATVPAGTDIGSGFAASGASAALGLSGDGVLVLADVPAAETVTTALNRIEGLDCTFYWVGLVPSITAVEDDVLAAVAWVQSRAYHLVVDVSGTGALAPGETTSLAARVSAQASVRIGAFYNGPTVDQKALSYMARFSSIDFAQPGSLINGKFKRLPGTTPTALTEAEKQELRRKRVNFYAPSGSAVARTAEGVTFGTWTDVQVWIDWFQNALGVAADNLLVSSATVPQTNQGVSAMLNALIAVCDQGVRNGGIAPNEVSAALRREIQQAGNPAFDGTLTTGYLVVAGTIASLTQAQRDARQMPSIKIFVKGAGAINDVVADVVFEN